MAGEQTVVINTNGQTDVKVLVNAIGSSGSHVALVIDQSTTRLDGYSNVPAVNNIGTGIALLTFSNVTGLTPYMTLVCKVNGTADSVVFSQYAISVKVLPDPAAVADSVWDESVTSVVHNAPDTAGNHVWNMRQKTDKLTFDGSQDLEVVLNSAGSTSLVDLIWDENLPGRSNPPGSAGLYTYSSGVAGLKLDTMLSVVPGTSPFDYQFTDSALEKVPGLVWSYLTTDATTTNSFGVELKDISARVWDESISSHNNAGTFGKGFRQVKEGLVSQDGEVNDSSATTTSFVSNLSSTVNDFWNEKVLVFTSGSLAGQSRVISDYDGATKTLTFDEGFTSAPANSSEFIILSVHVHPVDEIVQSVWSEPTTSYTTTGTFGDSVNDILVDTDNLQQNQGNWLTATGFSTFDPATQNVTVDGFTDAGKAEVESEVNDALVAIGLDHLVSTSVSGTDVADDSIIAKMVSKGATADWDTFSNTHDSLEAIRDRGDSSWTTATGFNTIAPPSASDIADAVWDEAAADHTSLNSTGAKLSGASGVTDKIDDMLELDGSVYRFTSNALEQGSSSLSSQNINDISASVYTYFTGQDTVDGVTTQREDAFKADPASIWGELTNSYTTAGTFGKSVNDILADTNELQGNQGGWLTATGFSTHSAADVAEAVWDEATSGHNSAGTFGRSVNDIKTATDKLDDMLVSDPDGNFSQFTDEAIERVAGIVWGDSITSYTTPATFGYSFPTKASITQVDNNVTHIKTVTDRLNGMIVGDPDGTEFQFTDAAIERVAGIVWDEAVTGHTTANTFGQLQYLREMISYDSTDQVWEFTDSSFNTVYDRFNDPSSAEIYDYFTATTDGQGADITPRNNAFKADVTGITATVGSGDITNIATAVWEKNIGGYTNSTGDKAGHHLLRLDNAIEIYNHFIGSEVVDGVTTQREDAFKVSPADVYSYFTATQDSDGNPISPARAEVFRSTDEQIKLAVSTSVISTSNGVDETLTDYLTGIKDTTDKMQFIEPVAGTFLIKSKAEQFDTSVYQGMYDHFTEVDEEASIDRPSVFKDSVDIAAIKTQTDKMNFTETFQGSGVFNINANAAVAIGESDAAVVYNYFTATQVDGVDLTPPRADAFKASLTGLATSTDLTDVANDVTSIKNQTDQMVFGVNILDANGDAIGKEVRSDAPSSAAIYDYFVEDNREKTFQRPASDIYTYFTDTPVDSDGNALANRAEAFKDGVTDETIYDHFTDGTNADAFKASAADVYGYFTQTVNDADGNPVSNRQDEFKNTASEIRDALGLQTNNLDAQLEDIPTVTEFEERTILAANYFDPSQDTVDVGKLFGDAGSAQSLKESAKQMTRCTVTSQSTPATAGGRSSFSSASVTTAAADHFVGRLILFTSGTLEGQASDIVDYELSNGVGLFSVTELTSDPAVNDTFIIV
jgi:hypothetical protein